MDSIRLPHRGSAARPLTTPASLGRLMGLMAGWWTGWTLDRLGRLHRISRQRVGVLLARVGCTRRLWRHTDHQRADSIRRATPNQIAKARAALLHPLSHRLTVRQRAAFVWQLHGLILVDIARRMGTTPQNVQRLLAAGRWRLERLSRAKHRPATPDIECLPLAITPPDYEGLLPLAWDELLTEIIAPTAPSGRPGRGQRTDGGDAGPAGGASVRGETPATPRGTKRSLEASH